MKYLILTLAVAVLAGFFAMNSALVEVAKADPPPPLTGTCDPNPFGPEEGFDVHISGGVPPYGVWQLPSPPNPPGVTVQKVDADTWHVTVPSNTPSNTPVYLRVRDSDPVVGGANITVTNTTF